MAEIKNQQQSLVNTSQFAEMVFVGVKKIETFSFVSDESDVYEDVLEAIAQKQHKGKVMLGFFSIPNLVDEHIDKIDVLATFNDNTNENMLRQSLKKVALIDFADAVHEDSQKINVVIAADCIMHWDNQGSYIQPTDDHSYLFDLEEILSAYPSSYEFNVYTNKDLSSFKAKEINQDKVINAPIVQGMWYNQPSFQQIYGNIVLTAGLACLAICYGAVSWQKSNIEDLNFQISNLAKVQINDSFYKNSNKELSNLKEKVQYKKTSGLILKDISNSISTSGFELDKISFKYSDDKNIMIDVYSKLNKHTQYSVQEPLARRIIDNSLFIKAIRKKVSKEQRLQLEALVNLQEAKAEIDKINKERR